MMTPIDPNQSPRTTPTPAPSGREISRRNAMTHGLSGSGKVIPEEDMAEVDRRTISYIKDLRVRTDMGRDLSRQLAVTSVRMDRCCNHELVAIAHNRRHAIDRHDDAREDEASRLLEALGEDPRGSLRRLKRMPEGMMLLIEAWRHLRSELTRKPSPRWTAWHRERAENLTGNRSDHNPYTSIGDLSEAIWGATLGTPEDKDGAEEAARARGRARMIERIDAEIKALEAHDRTLDRKGLELDRKEAPDRALFDDSKPAQLARRYEAEASRRYFKLLDLIRKAEAEAAEREPSPASPPPPTSSAPPASSRGPVVAASDSFRAATRGEAVVPRDPYCGLGMVGYLEELERLDAAGHFDDPDALPLRCLK